MDWGGRVIAKPISWQEILKLTDQTGIPSDFMVYRQDLPADEKGLF